MPLSMAHVVNIDLGLKKRFGFISFFLLGL